MSLKLVKIQFDFKICTRDKDRESRQIKQKARFKSKNKKYNKSKIDKSKFGVW